MVYDESLINRELRYINKEIIGKQKNNKYCKYSRIAKSITATNFTEKQYLDYWMGILRTKNLSEEDFEKVRIAIKNKFEEDLTDLSVVIKLEELSNDQDKVKTDIIKEITSSK